MTKFVRLFVFLGLVLLCPSCNQASDLEMHGIVVTSPGLEKSFLLPSDHAYDSCERPVAGATIYLAFDKEGKQSLNGYQAKSDENGKYSISLRDIPPSKTTYGNEYFLLVKKKGYITLCYPINTGPLSSFMENTIFLKAIANEKP